METIKQITGTNDLKTNLIAFVLLSLVIVLIVSFTFLASVNGLKSF